MWWCSVPVCVLALRYVCDWPRNVNRFPVSSFQPNPLPLRLSPFHPPPPTCLPDYCLVVYAVGASLSHSVSHNHNHSFDSANKPAHTPTICFKHLLVHAPSSLETRTPTGEASHPASLHHYIIQSFVTQDPRPHPELPIVAPVDLEPKNTDTQLSPSLSALLSDCELVVTDSLRPREVTEVSEKSPSPFGRAYVPAAQAARPQPDSVVYL